MKRHFSRAGKTGFSGHVRFRDAFCETLWGSRETFNYAEKRREAFSSKVVIALPRKVGFPVLYFPDIVVSVNIYRG